MKISTHRISLPLVAVALAGCATGPDVPLIFVASNTIGVSVGAIAPAQGVDFVIGYRGHDFAMVPVTAEQPDGGALQLGGTVGTGTFDDAFSVFGQFKADVSSSTSAPKNSMGKFFATGMAAKRLADGYAAKLGRGRSAIEECGGQAKKKGDEKQVQTDSEKRLNELMAVQGRIQDAQVEVLSREGELQQQQRALQQEQARSVVEVVHKPGTGSEPREIGRGKTMYFAQYSSLGFVFSVSPTPGASEFSIAWKDRNVAIVPVVKRDAQGNPSPILSKDYTERPHGQDRNDYDAYSVLGQFEFTTSPESTAAVKVGLGKFFTTGQAAKGLSDGFAANLCEQYAPQGALPEQEKAAGVAAPAKPPVAGGSN